MTRGKRNATLPPANGRLVRKPADCTLCFKPCQVGGQLKETAGYYVYHEEKACRECAVKLGVL